MKNFDFKKPISANPPVFQRIYNHLYKANTFSLERLRHIQLAELSRLLFHAAQHVPFYKHRIPEKINCLEDYFDITPVLKRREYQENMDFCRARSMPPGMLDTGMIYTSGSTGTPVGVAQTNATQDWYKALHIRDLEWNGLDPKQTLAAIIFFDKSAEAWNGTSRPYWDHWIAEIMACGASYGLSIERDPKDQVAWLQKVNPYYLATYPSNIELLTEHINSLSKLKLQCIKSFSEPLTRQIRKTLQPRFTIKDTYSCREIGYLASECEHGKLHVHSENVILEIVNEQMKPCAPGETGQVLLTSLHNYLSPLFRYAIGDYAAFGGPCQCGRQHPVIERIEGKIHPPFKISNNRWKNSIEVHSAMRKIGGFKQFQVIQKERTFTVNIIPGLEWNDSYATRITSMFSDFYEAHVDVTINLLNRIPLHKGKLRHLIVEHE